MKKENIKNIRKSIISMMVIMVMVITMVGCNKETTENTPNVTIDETISSEITETTTEVVSEEVENTEESREIIDNGDICTYANVAYESGSTTIEFVDTLNQSVYAKTTKQVDIYNPQGVHMGYVKADSNVFINFITNDYEWVRIITSNNIYLVKYEDFYNPNAFVETDTFTFDWIDIASFIPSDEVPSSETIVADNNVEDKPQSDTNTTTEQPSNNEPTVVQPTTEEPTTPPPSTPTTEEVVVEPTPEPEPEPQPTVTADQIVAEFNAAFSACGMTPAPDGPSGLGYGGIRCKTGNYKEQANAAAWTCSSMGYKYFYITISDNGDGSFMVTYYYG